MTAVRLALDPAAWSPHPAGLADPVRPPLDEPVADDSAGALRGAEALLTFVDRTWKSLG